MSPVHHSNAQLLICSDSKLPVMSPAREQNQRPNDMNAASLPEQRQQGGFHVVTAWLDRSVQGDGWRFCDAAGMRGLTGLARLTATGSSRPA
jgi:hypothetical protein